MTLLPIASLGHLPVFLWIAANQFALSSGEASELLSASKLTIFLSIHRFAFRCFIWDRGGAGHQDALDRLDRMPACKGSLHRRA